MSTGDASARPGHAALPVHAEIARALRQARRRGGLSQRALAERAGVNQATVARLEARADARLGVAAQVLASVHLQLGVLDEGGCPVGVDVDADDDRRDTGGRRLPAHLATEQSRRLPSWTFTRRMIAGGPLPFGPGTYWLFHRRPPHPGDPPTGQDRADSS